MVDTIGRETATVAPAERNVRRLFGAVACWITSVCARAVSASFLKEGLKRYCNPPLAHEDTQLKQSTQREVSTVRFLLSIASALQVCSQLPQCVQASLSKDPEKRIPGDQAQQRSYRAKRIAEQPSPEYDHEDEYEQRDQSGYHAEYRHVANRDVIKRIVIHPCQSVGQQVIDPHDDRTEQVVRYTAEVTVRI